MAVDSLLADGDITAGAAFETGLKVGDGEAGFGLHPLFELGDGGLDLFSGGHGFVLVSVDFDGGEFVVFGDDDLASGGRTVIGNLPAWGVLNSVAVSVGFEGLPVAGDSGLIGSGRLFREKGGNGED